LCSHCNANAQEQNGRPILKANSLALRNELANSTAAPQVEPSDASLEQHFADWQMLDGCVQALKRMGDAALKQEFKLFADVQTEAENSAAEEGGAFDKKRMSVKGLAALFAAKNVTLSEDAVEELMSRIDSSGDRQADWHEFRALVRSSSELEMVFKGFPVERVLASCFAKGTADDPLDPFFKQQHSDVVAALRKAGHILIAMTTGVIKKHNEARASQGQGAGGGAKFGAELKGANVDAFYRGVTGLVGEPHPGLSSCVCVCIICCMFVCCLESCGKEGVLREPSSVNKPALENFETSMIFSHSF